MTNNELYILIRSTLIDLLDANGYPNLKVIANYQPTHQGREVEPTIYFFHVSGNRYGWQQKTYDFNSGNDDFDSTETQLFEETLQFSALAPQDPTDVSAFTAGDWVELVSMIINSRPFVETVSPSKVGVRRITQVRKPNFSNDQSQFEYSPNFDVTFSYQKTISGTVPAVDEFRSKQGRV